MRIAIAVDHAAVEHKRAVIAHLQAQGHTVADFGTDSSASCDYPDHGLPACVAVAKGECQRGILICGTGIGMSIAANKVPGIRCGLAHSVDTARLAANHNNAQVLALGARIVDIPTALAMVDVFLTTPFESRHQRRLDKIAAFEKQPAC
ncbi:MAG: ribose 5-phosphate isomerase [Planctomycetota bacterium]|jgi:ribose 5-phosphate isomerase B